MKKTLLSIFSAALLLGTQSCKDDIDIFAPGEEVTVIYGLLNAKDSLQNIKINKVFQGQGTLEELAKNPSNSEYENLDSAKIIEFEILGRDTFPTGRKWYLEEDLVTNKDSGFFYYPNQKIYSAKIDLLTDKYYQIHIDKQDGSPVVTSFSEVLQVRDGKSTLTKPQGVDLSLRGLALSAEGEEPLEDPIAMEFDLPVNAKVIEVFIDLSYRNQFKNNTYGPVQTLSYKVTSQVVSEIKEFEGDLVEPAKTTLDATSFYSFIASKVPVLDPAGDIRQRVLMNVPLKFRYVFGGQELSTYMEVSEPSTSLLESKPEYTNVNNGIGVFSCRSFEEMDGYLSRNSITYLVEGPITAGRGFCHNTDNNSSFYCY